jgi:hypothetical protein
VCSEIEDGLYKRLSVEADSLDRRNPNLKIREVLSERMHPPFDYECIIDKYSRRAEKEFGSELPAKEMAPRSYRKRRGARGKPNPFPK